MSGDLAAARREAEEALAEYDRLWGAAHATNAYGRAVVGLASALRALLAAGPEAKAPGHDRIAELESLLRECNAVCLCGCPDSEHEADECGESCGHANHECIRVAPAVLEIVQRYRVALAGTPAPRPAQDADSAVALLLAVWDAWHRVGYEPEETIDEVINRVGDWRWNNGFDEFNPPTKPVPPWPGIRERDEEIASLRAELAEWTEARQRFAADRARLDASLAPRPAPDAVREAAEVIRTILTAHDARLSESGVLTYGPPSKGTGFVAAIQWLRRYDAARGGE